jgi:hypothetical protein
MNIIYKPSAFEHKIKEADIRYAFMNPYYDGPIEDDSAIENRYLRIGFDRAGNLLEIMYNEYGDIYCIFHAMKCRSIYLHLLRY